MIPRAAALTVALASALAVVPVMASAGSAFEVEGAEGASELLVQNHGKQMRATLHGWDWCPEEGDYCHNGTIDYAHDPNPRRLPFHRRSVMRLKTGRAARAITLRFSRPGRNRRVPAKRRDDGGMRWIVRVPGSVDAVQEVGILVDYRYRKDGRRYGGRYSFSIAVREHRHQPD